MKKESNVLVHGKVMHHLKKSLEIIKDLIGDSSVSYLDIPFHGNTGDQLIYQGTLKFLKESKINIKHVSAAYSKPMLYDTEVILLHGGGNFGDLYAIHQRYREGVIQLNPDKRIIVLPQSIYFESECAQNHSAEIFAKHKDLHIFTRDIRSFRIAEKFSTNNYLSPDMAHWLYESLKVPKTSSAGMLRIRRKDKEAMMGREERPGCAAYDWDSMLPSYLSAFMQAYLIVGKAILKSPVPYWFKGLTLKGWDKISRKMISETMRFYSTYSLVETDRLHGHILAMLLDKKNIVVDNSYGKNSSYTEVWTAASPLLSQLNRS